VKLVKYVTADGGKHDFLMQDSENVGCKRQLPVFYST